MGWSAFIVLVMIYGMTQISSMISDYLEERDHVEEGKINEELSRMTNQSIDSIRQIK
jgi:hypothetical protein